MNKRPVRLNPYAVLTVILVLFVFLAPSLIENPILTHMSKDFAASSHATMSDQSVGVIVFGVINWAAGVAAFVFSLIFRKSVTPKPATEGLVSPVPERDSRVLVLIFIVLTSVIAAYFTIRLLLAVFFLFALNH